MHRFDADASLGQLALSEYQCVLSIAVVRTLHLRFEAASAEVQLHANSCDHIPQLLRQGDRTLQRTFSDGDETFDTHRPSHRGRRPATQLLDQSVVASAGTDRAL